MRLNNFFKFSISLWKKTITRPRELPNILREISLNRCLKFGWLCFFMGSALSSFYQLVFVNAVIEQVTNDPNFGIELAKSISFLDPSLDKIEEKLELVKLTSYATALLAPISAFVFLHLISGALYVVSKAICSPADPNRSYEQVMKVVAIGQAPILFCAIPLLGPMVGTLWSIWLIARLLGEVFEISFFGRIGLVTFAFVFLFSFWNSTVSKLVSAYHQKSIQDMSVQKSPKGESNASVSDLI